MLNLIINADDFGLCPQRDKGIISLFENNKISSASVIINGINAEQSLKIAKEKRYPVGLHLNLTEGFLTNRLNEENNSLVENQSYFGLSGYLMHGKQGFRDKLNQNLIQKSDIEKEVYAQFKKFIKLYGGLPTHVDGHQHVHIIPQVAQIIAEIMTTYWGIYKVRIPLEDLGEIQNPFYHQIQTHSKQSIEIYKQYNIIYPDHFIGLRVMNEKFTHENISKLLNELLKNSNTYVELMCHPGLKSEYFDDFNQSELRFKELEVINQGFQNIQLASFKDLQKDIHGTNILIYSDLTIATGNLTTANRIKYILQNENTNVFMRNLKIIDDDNQQETNNEIDDIAKFAFQFKIQIIFGIHLWRSGKILYKAFTDFAYEKKYIQIPYCLIISGTDANEFIYDEKYFETIQNIYKKSSYIVSLNELMLEKVKKRINQTSNHEQVIYQSIDTYTTSKLSLRKIYNLNEQDKLIILPSSIRKIKDIIFPLTPLCELFQLNQFKNHYLFILGPVLDQNYYTEILNHLEGLFLKYPDFKNHIKINIQFSHQDYLSLLKEADLVLNTSINEGMSGSILEALHLKVPVLVRNIEGNTFLINDEVNGYVFDQIETFKQKYQQVFANEILKFECIKRGYEKIQSHFNQDQEKHKYNLVRNQMLSQSYQDVQIFENNYRIFNPDCTHQLSNENFDIFNKIQFNTSLNDLNVLDMACGNGIFGFHLLQKIKQYNLSVRNMVFSDVVDAAVQTSKFNVWLNNDKLNHVKSFNYIQSDMWNSIFPQFREQKVDLVVANFPQTPCTVQFKVDRCGMEDGSYFSCEFAKGLKNITHQNSIIFMLHISVSNPQKIFNEFNKNGFDVEKVFVQKRTITNHDYDKLHVGIFPQILKLKSEGQIHFEYDKISESTYLCQYEVELLKITPK